MAWNGPNGSIVYNDEHKSLILSPLTTKTHFKLIKIGWSSAFITKTDNCSGFD